MVYFQLSQIHSLAAKRLAVSLDVVDRLRDSRTGYAQNDRKTIELLQGLTVG